MQRYFVNANPAQEIVLPADTAHHLVTVMRATVGTQVELVLNDHQAYLAAIVSEAPQTKVKIVKRLAANSELPVAVTLACGLPKTKEKPELIVQKATELGANQVVFFEAARSISHWQGNKKDRKLARLQKIAVSAAEQSHRNKVPSIHYCASLKELLATFPATRRIVAWEESAKQGETSALAQQFKALKTGDTIMAIFGPEGGLTTDEIAAMNDNGVVAAGLGPRILRTETAPLYFMAALSYALELA